MDPNIQSVKEAVDQLGRAWEEFKAVSCDRFQRDETKLDRIQDELDRLETALNRTVRETGVPEREVLAQSEREHKEAFLTYLRKGFEEGLPAFERKALSVGSDPDGGYLVPATMADRIVTRIFESSPLRQVANVLQISTDRVEFLVDKDEAASGGWVGETETRVETATPQLAKHTIAVHEQFAEPRASQKLLDDAAIDVESWLVGKVTDKFARTENAAFVNGDGVAKPRGFTTYPAGTAWEQVEQISSGDASALTADGLIDLQNALKTPYQQRALWVMTRASVRDIRKLKDLDGQYLWQPGLAQDQPPLLLGHPILMADDMPGVAANALALAYGDFSAGYQIVDRIGIRVLRDPFTAKPQVKFYTIKRVGGDVVNFEAIKLQKVAA